MADKPSKYDKMPEYEFPVRDSKDAEMVRKAAELDRKGEGLTPDIYDKYFEYSRRKIKPGQLESTSPFPGYAKGGMVKHGSASRAPALCKGGKIISSRSY